MLVMQQTTKKTSFKLCLVLVDQMGILIWRRLPMWNFCQIFLLDKKNLHYCCCCFSTFD